MHDRTHLNRTAARHRYLAFLESWCADEECEGACDAGWREAHGPDLTNTYKMISTGHLSSTNGGASGRAAVFHITAMGRRQLAVWRQNGHADPKGKP